MARRRVHAAGPHAPPVRPGLRDAGCGARRAHRRRRRVGDPGRHLCAGRAALLRAGGRAVRRRGHARLGAVALPRPERQHARLRGDDRRLRGHTGCALPAARRGPGPRHHRAPGRGHRWRHLGALPRRLDPRLGLQPARPQQHLPPLGLPARALHRMGQAAVPAGCAAPAALAPAARDGAVRPRLGRRVGRGERRHALRLCA